VASLDDLEVFDPVGSDSPRAAFQGKLRRRATV